MKAVLISAHGDDALACAAGTIQSLVEDGHEVEHHTLSLSGISLPEPFTTEDYADELSEAFGILEISNDIYGLTTRSFPDHRGTIRELLYGITREADLIITHSPTDTHQDHRVVGEEIMRVAPKSSSILAYDMPWSSNKVPSAFYPMDTYALEVKISALWQLDSQQVKAPQYLCPEAVEALARVRGLACGSQYAEAFECLRFVR